MLEELPVLTLVQPVQGKDVGTPVTELREEAGHGLGAMIRAEHQQVPLAGQRVLRHHPHPGLDVALVEIGNVAPGGRLEGSLQSVDGFCDIERQRAAGSNEVHGRLRVVGVGLDAVGQPHRDEVRVRPVLAQTVDGELSQSPGQRRVDPTGDPEDESPVPVADR